MTPKSTINLFLSALFCCFLIGQTGHAAAATDAGVLYRNCTAMFQLSKLRHQAHEFEASYIMRLNQAALKCTATLNGILETVQIYETDLEKDVRKICTPDTLTAPQMARLIVLTIKKNAHLLPLPQSQVVVDILAATYPCKKTHDSTVDVPKIAE